MNNEKLPIEEIPNLETRFVLIYIYAKGVVIKIPSCFLPSEEIAKVIHVKNKHRYGNKKLNSCYVVDYKDGIEGTEKICVYKS